LVVFTFASVPNPHAEHLYILKHCICIMYNKDVGFVILPSVIMIGYLSICSYLSYFLPKNVIHVMIIQWMIYIANRTHYPFKSIMFHLVDLWISVSMTLICFIQVLYHNCFYFVTSLTWVLCFYLLRANIQKCM
jgi:hypothetical protein